MAYTCSVCGDQVGDDALVFIQHTEKHIIDEIRKKHPEWVEHDGVCKKCESFLRSQLRGEGA